MILTFGKYKGSDITTIPDSYLEWGFKNLSSLRWCDAFQAEKLRRQQSQNTLKTLFRQGKTEEVLQILQSQAQIEIEEEISNSGCEHEYDISRFDLIDDLVNEKFNKLKFDFLIEDLNNEYIQKLGTTSDMLLRVSSAYFNNELSRDNFGSEEKYLLGIEYCQKLDSIYSLGLFKG